MSIEWLALAVYVYATSGLATLALGYGLHGPPPPDLGLPFLVFVTLTWPVSLVIMTWGLIQGDNPGW